MDRLVLLAKEGAFDAALGRSRTRGPFGLGRSIANGSPAPLDEASTPLSTLVLDASEAAIAVALIAAILLSAAGWHISRPGAGPTFASRYLDPETTGAIPVPLRGTIDP